ncbi:MAG: phosphoribosyl-ATP diphosphatase [Pelagibacterales bacterium]|nr:phosphoribosyl-ATP diphosphatase [Pelagibacterales bacterium]
MPKKLDNSLDLEDIFSLVKNKISSKEKGSYSYDLTKGGTEKITRKIGEEAVEVMIAAFLNEKQNNKKTKEDLIGEICDLFYHNFVLMASQNIDFNDILKELNKRNIKKSSKK